MIKSNTLILKTATLYIVPIQLMFSIFILLRGHDEPGGGFIGGLVAAAAFVLYALSFGVDRASLLLRVTPKDFIAVGLLFGVSSVIPSLLTGESAFKAHWWYLNIAENTVIKLSTPLVFDIGVFFTVLGTVTTFIFYLMEVQDEK